MTDNPYQPPRTDFSKPIASNGNPQAGGTLQDGIEGNYDFEIMAVLQEAWQRTEGFKSTIIGAGIIMFFILFVLVAMNLMITLLLVWMASIDQEVTVRGVLLESIRHLMNAALVSPFLAGVMMLGIRRAVDLPIEFAIAFSYFGRAIPLTITAVLISILTTLGFVLLLLPGIYLSVGYILAMPLVAEKKLPPWQALEASRQAISYHWFKVFFTYLLMSIIFVISFLPLGIGSIWTVTMMVNLNGILYRIIFGVEEAR
jgi:hypothetical protein